jgi:hypothetical protein
VSFSISKKALVANFESLSKMRGFFSKFNLLLSSILIYLTHAKSYSTFVLSSSSVSTGSLKLNELALIDSKLIQAFQKNCVTVLLYPLIFETMKTNVVNLGSSSVGSNFSSTSAVTLKFLTLK